MTSTPRRRGGHPARVIVDRSNSAQERRGRWAGSPDEITEPQPNGAALSLRRTRVRPPFPPVTPTPRRLDVRCHPLRALPARRLSRQLPAKRGARGVRGVRVSPTHSFRVPGPSSAPSARLFPLSLSNRDRVKGEKCDPTHPTHHNRGAACLPCGLALRPHAPHTHPTGLRRLPLQYADAASFLGTPTKRPIQLHINSHVAQARLQPTQFAAQSPRALGPPLR